MPCLKIKVNLLIFHYQKQLIPLAAGKPYNLTYFIMFVAVATFRDPFLQPPIENLIKCAI